MIDLEQKNKLNKEFDKQLIQLKSENKKIQQAPKSIIKGEKIKNKNKRKRKAKYYL